MKTKIVKYFLLGWVAVLISTSSMAQPGNNENPFMDRKYWESQPSLTDIKANVAKGYSATEANRGGFDPITFAIFSGNSVVSIEYLLAQGNDINKRTHDSRTYLFWAASRGNLELMNFLIENGARIDLVDSHGYSVTQFAAASGQSDTLVYDLLIKSGAILQNEKDHHGRSVLLVAAPRVKDMSLIDYFVSKGLSIDELDDEGNGIFNIAAQGGNIDVLKELVAKGVATDKNVKTGENAVLFASRGGRGSSSNLEVFKYLEGLGLNANVTSIDGVTPLHNIAGSSNDLAIFEYFINKGGNPNAVDEAGNTPLLNAVSRNNLEVIKYLLEKTEDINYRNKKGHSALILAIQNNTASVVDYLIEQGAQIDVFDNDGNNLAYYLFATRGNPKDFDAKVKALLGAGFNFKHKQSDKSTIWHLAIAKNSLELIEKVKDFGADINAKDEQGNTVLHYAAMKATNTKILEFLVANGADINSTTEFGETAFDLAQENELLQENNVSLDFLN